MARRSASGQRNRPLLLLATGALGRGLLSPPSPPCACVSAAGPVVRTRAAGVLSGTASQAGPATLRLLSAPAEDDFLSPAFGSALYTCPAPLHAPLFEAKDPVLLVFTVPQRGIARFLSEAH